MAPPQTLPPSALDLRCPFQMGWTLTLVKSYRSAPVWTPR